MENNKQSDIRAILKLYELRRDEELRRARRRYFTEFAPQSAGGAKLVISGVKESVYYRTVTASTRAHWTKNFFLDANSEHILVFAKLQPFLAELRQLFSDPNYNAHLEQLVMRSPNAEEKLESRRKLMALWADKSAA